MSLFALLVFPSISYLSAASSITHLGEGTKLGLIVFLALALGVLLNALSVPLYRILEGYLGWPGFIKNRRITHYAKVQKTLQERMDDPNQTRLQRGFAAEKLALFPKDEGNIAPTRLGNAMRAIETFGSHTFKLDSQVLWSELRAVLPDTLNSDIDSAKAGIDVFIALIYLSLGFSAACLAVFLEAPQKIHMSHRSLLVAGGVSLLLVPIWYRQAVASTRSLRSAVHAMVMLGRGKLAKSLGLEVPATLEAERVMWSSMSRLSLMGYNDRTKQRWDAVRAQRPPQAPASGAGDGTKPMPPNQTPEEARGASSTEPGTAFENPSAVRPDAPGLV
ncbi:MAG TPA: hypothetical protein VKR22_09445 [Acidimicrobiales bacterium]|nr:hypothetical protein [Acidimicrobiales bacterium]